MVTLLGTETPNTPAWHALRAGGIGASEIAAVVGLSPYESAFHLWHVKKGNLPGAKLSDAMDWGNRLEPVVREWFAERHPDWDVIAQPGTYANDDHMWQRVNPDGVIDKPAEGLAALLEVKTSRYGDEFGRSGTDIIPLNYRCQVQHAMDVFDLPVCHLAALIGGNEPREYVIRADAGDQRALREAGAAFWESLQNNDEPPLDCSDSTYESVRDLNPEIDREADIEIGALWSEYEAARVVRDDSAAKLTGVKSQILAAMGTARIATANTEPVLRRQMSSAGTPYLKEIA